MSDYEERIAKAISELAALLPPDRGSALQAAWDSDRASRSKRGRSRKTMALWSDVPVGDGRWQRMVDSWAEQIVSARGPWADAADSILSSALTEVSRIVSIGTSREGVTSQEVADLVWSDPTSFHEILFNGTIWGDVPQTIGARLRHVCEAEVVQTEEVVPFRRGGEDFAIICSQIRGDEDEIVSALRSSGAWDIEVECDLFTFSVEVDWSNLKAAIVGMATKFADEGWKEADEQESWGHYFSTWSLEKRLARSASMPLTMADMPADMAVACKAKVKVIPSKSRVPAPAAVGRGSRGGSRGNGKSTPKSKTKKSTSY